MKNKQLSILFLVIFFCISGCDDGSSESAGTNTNDSSDIESNKDDKSSEPSDDDDDDQNNPDQSTNNEGDDDDDSYNDDDDNDVVADDDDDDDTSSKPSGDKDPTATDNDDKTTDPDDHDSGSTDDTADTDDADAATDDTDKGTDTPALDIPEPVKKPDLWGMGIGITNLDDAIKFFTEVMGMKIEKENVDRGDRVDTVLYSKAVDRGARLILMKFKDNRNTRKITAKLVWHSANATQVSTKARSYPDYNSRVNMGTLVQFDGPDTYIQEVGVFDSGAIHLVSLGFSTSNQRKSIRFYKQVFGMQSQNLGMPFTVTDVNGTSMINETTVNYGGVSLVLQDWTTPRKSKDNPVMSVHFVPNAQAIADKIKAAGGSIVTEAKRSAAYDNRLLIVAKDPDGYLIELVQ